VAALLGGMTLSGGLCGAPERVFSGITPTALRRRFRRPATHGSFGWGGCWAQH